MKVSWDDGIPIEKSTIHVPVTTNQTQYMVPIGIYLQSSPLVASTSAGRRVTVEALVCRRPRDLLHGVQLQVQVHGAQFQLHVQVHQRREPPGDVGWKPMARKKVGLG